MTRRADPFADALESFWRAGKGSYRYTREDGWSQVEDAWWYFTNYRDFPLFEKQALRWARGRVLDLGCGAGRHSLYLQRRGFEITAIDASARVAAISRARGVQRMCVATTSAALPFDGARFDTVLLLGNNLGLGGGAEETGRMLQEIARVTRPKAQIIATTRAPGTSARQDLDYWNKQLAKGKEIGAMRLRLDFRGRHRRWATLFLISPDDLLGLAWHYDWVVTRLYGAAQAEEGYAAIIEKRG